MTNDAPLDVRVRDEQPSDHEAVFGVVERAFESPGEARLVARLRDVAEPWISLVAEAEGRVVGHVSFSPVMIVGSHEAAGGEAPGATTAIGLAPLAVDPPCQKRGVGSALVREGLARCRAIGEELVFVLGSPAYYGRFGFQFAAPLGLHFQGPQFDPHFMLVELLPGALRERRGEVRYHPLFDEL